MTKEDRVQLRLDREHKAILRKMADQRGISMSDVVRDLIIAVDNPGEDPIESTIRILEDARDRRRGRAVQGPSAQTTS